MPQMLATHKRLSHEAEKLAETLHIDSNPSTLKKKRAKETRKLEKKVKLVMEEGRMLTVLGWIRLLVGLLRSRLRCQLHWAIATTLPCL